MSRNGESVASSCWADEAVLTRAESLDITKLERGRMQSRLRKPDVWRRDGRVVSVVSRTRSKIADEASASLTHYIPTPSVGESTSRAPLCVSLTDNPTVR